MRFAIVYRRTVCKNCHSRMVTHVEQNELWRFGCSMCKREIDKQVIAQVEAEEWPYQKESNG